MVKTSVFEKYKEYDKKTINLAIETMSSEERMNLKKGYGKNYKGVNGINKHDVASFELVDRKFKRRIEEISNLIKEGKTENEIKQKYSSTLLSSYTRKVVIPKKVSATTNYKLLPSFLDFFESTPLIQKRVEKMLDSISEEDRKIIEYYYIGSKFNILRSYYEQDNEKYQQLQSLIGRLKNEAIKQPKKETAKLVNQSTQIKTTKKETVKTNEPSKKIDDKKSEINKIDENKNPYNLLPSFISYFPSNLITTTKKIMRNFSPKDKQVVGYFYSGVSFNGLRDYAINDEKFTQLNILINKIKINAIKALKEENKIIDNKDEIKNNKKKEKTLLDFFEEKDHEKVLEIVKQFEMTNPKYYKVIIKKYSGEKYDEVHGILTKEENILLCSAKTKIKKQLLNQTKEIKGELFLNFFEEKDHEKVLEIVKQFETTAPGYYSVITKRYSGERFEIINQKLTDEENSLLSGARARIKKMLLNEVKEMKGEPFLNFFEEKDHEKVLEIVKQFGITNQVYYEVITKKYSGERFEIINKCKLTQKENANLYNAKNKIKKLLLNPVVEKKKEYLLDFFEEKDHEKVLEIVNQFKITNPTYYRVITKRYSGERFEVINDCKLTQKEYVILNNAKNRIKKIILGKAHNKKGKKFLSFFEEKDHEKVLEIVNQFKITNPTYYASITKRYSGERFEIINEGKLMQKEHSNLTMIRKEIKEMLLKQDVIESTQEKNNKQELPILEDKKSQSNKLVEKTIHIYSIQDILYILPNKPIDNILMNQIIKNRQSILRYISIDEVVDCYIDNLEYFKDEDAITIIKTISIYCPDKITKIINSSYLSDKLNCLTLKEQEYIYLTLRSYSNKFLTKDVISEMLDIDKKELEKYEIMSQYDDVNKLNILLKD